MAEGGFANGGGGGFNSPGQGGGFHEEQHPRGFHGRFTSTGGQPGTEGGGPSSGPAAGAGGSAARGTAGAGAQASGATAGAAVRAQFKKLGLEATAQKAQVKERIKSRKPEMDALGKLRGADYTPEARQRVKEIADQNAADYEQLSRIDERMKHKASALVNVPPDKMTDVEEAMGPGTEAIKQTAYLGVNEFNQLCGRDSARGQEVPVKVSTGSGNINRVASYYDPADGFVALTPNAGKKTMVHEMGHWLEDIDPEVHRQAVAFLERRTQGEPVQLLADLNPGNGYDPKEETQPDKFISPYVGKRYVALRGGRTERTATEVVSMGLEHMYADPVAFAKADPDHFDFIYDLMRG